MEPDPTEKARDRDLEEVLRRVDDLAAKMADLTDRVEVLEGLPPGARALGGEGDEERPEIVGPEAESVRRVVVLVGRTLVVLGGAFLIRSLTGGGNLPDQVGLGLGILYALLWVVAADRIAGGERRVDASFHGLAAALIGFPLVWETTTVFELMSPRAGAWALLAFGAAILAVAWRRRLRSLAWVGTVGTAVTAFLLMGGTRRVLPFAAALVAVSLVAAWLGRRNGQPGVRALGAIAADVAIPVVTVVSAAPGVESGAVAAFVLQVAFFLGFSVSIAWWVRRDDRGLRWTEAGQLAAATVLAFGGAVVLVQAASLSPRAVGWVGTVLGVAAYAFVFGLVRRERRSTFSSFATVGLVVSIVGTVHLVPEPTPLWAGAALVLAGAGQRFSRQTLVLHSAVFAWAAASSGHLVENLVAGFADPPPIGWPPFGVWGFVALVAAIGCLLFRPPAENPFWGRGSRIPRYSLLLLSSLGAGSLVVRVLVPLVGGTGFEDGARLAVARTGVLCVAALALAALATFRGIVEASWAAWTTVVAGGLKLLVEDFPHGRPGTLFLSLALFGITLIVVARSGRKADPGEEADGNRVDPEVSSPW